MTALTLVMRGPPPRPLDLSPLLPERLSGRSEREIARLPLRHGNRTIPLGELFGIRWALAGLGVAIALVVVPALPHLRRLDDTLKAPSGLPLLQAIPMFAPLPSPVLETLARQLTTHQVSAGSPVFLEGDVGDAFYIIESGEIRIGHGATALRTEVAGDHFGEIALLRDVPRTADAVAIVDTVLRRLDRAVFLDAITGDTDAANAAESVVSRRLLAG